MGREGLKEIKRGGERDRTELKSWRRGKVNQTLTTKRGRRTSAKGEDGWTSWSRRRAGEASCPA